MLAITIVLYADNSFATISIVGVNTSTTLISILGLLTWLVILIFITAILKRKAKNRNDIEVQRIIDLERVELARQEAILKMNREAKKLQEDKTKESELVIRINLPPEELIRISDIPYSPSPTLPSSIYIPDPAQTASAFTAELKERHEEINRTRKEINRKK